MGSFLGGATGTNSGFVAQGAPITKQDFQPGIAQSAQQFGGVFDQQSQLANQLQQASLGFGPNPAQIQLQQATNQNIQQNAGMLASQRGLSPALAQRLAAQNGAATNQQSAGQAALMGAQQQVAARGQLAGVLGTQQQGALGMNQNLQNAQASQNSALTGMQSNLNSVNAGVAAGNQANNANLFGGALSGAALAFSHGGVVPQHFAGGGMSGMSYNPYMMQRQQNPYAIQPPMAGQSGAQSNTGGFLTNFAKSLFSSTPKPASGPGSQEDMDSGGLFTQQSQIDEGNESGLGSALFGGPTPDADAAPMTGTIAPSEGGMGGLAAMMAARGGQVPQRMANGGIMDTVKEIAPLAILALNRGGEPMGQVPGQAAVAGNSLKNDKVPAMLSPKEIIIPRSITMHPNAPALAAEFVKRELHKHHPDGQKKNYDEGGQIPDSINANAPQTELQPVNTGFDPGQEFIPKSPTDYGQVYENTYQQLRQNNPGEPESFSKTSAFAAAERAKQADQSAVVSNQQQQQSSMQQAHDAAIAENTRRQSLGMKPVPIPDAPVQLGQQMDQGQASPAMNQIPDMNKMAGDQPNPIGAMDQSMLAGYQKAVGEEKAGFNQAAQTQDVLGKQNAQIAHDQAKKEQTLMNDYQVQNKQLMGEYNSTMEDYKKGTINPNHYAESMSSVGKVRTAIGLILGGMGGGLLHQENPAAKFLSQQIDRDIDAQKSELGKKANLLTANYHQLGNLKDATEMSRAMMMGIQANQFREAAANAQGPMAKATALQEAGKLDERIAPIMSQIAVRQTMLRGMKSGTVDAGTAIQFMAPEKEKQELLKQYQGAQNMSRQRDNLLNAFDQVNKLNTVGSRIASPLQSTRSADALTEPLLAQLIKDSEGRITPQDTEMMKGLFPKVGDSDQTRRLRRSQLNKFISEKMNYPALRPYGFDPAGQSRYNAQGMDRLPPMAPPKR